MKKIAIFLIFTVIISCFFACNSTNSIKTSTNDQQTISSLTNTDDYRNSLDFEKEITGTIKDSGGGDITTRKYRVRYYTVPYQFILLVGVEEYQQWDEQYNTQNADDANEMMTKKFIQHFNISREDFDKANLEFAKVLTEGSDNKAVINPKDYADQEVDEIYNADIIYTFDDEIINEYYLSPNYDFGMKIEFEKAVANGEYTPRTEKWVDVEAMEAEIIAKYGEAEIVAEQETTIAVETTLPEAQITPETDVRITE